MTRPADVEGDCRWVFFKGILPGYWYWFGSHTNLVETHPEFKTNTSVMSDSMRYFQLGSTPVGVHVCVRQYTLHLVEF